MFCLRANSGGVVLPVFHRVTLGREAAQCTFVLNNIAAGRKHCEIYLEKNNELILIDFGTSALGTFVNQQSVTSEQPIRLQAGDVLSCGNETFTVMFLQNAKVMAARGKIARLVVECEKIRAKSSDGLSEGQTRTLDRNEKEIGSLEKQIYDWLQDTSATTEKEDGEEEENVLDVVEDSLLDKTNNIQQQTPKQPVKAYTYDSLMRRIRELDLEIEKFEQELSGGSASQNRDEEEEEEDELEKFMAMNAQELKGMDLEKIRQALRQARQEREQCEALAKLAKPTVAVTAANKPREEFRVIQQSVDLPQEEQARKRQQIKEEQVEETVALEQPVDAWQPPTNQTGDGRSKANLRFGY